MIDAEIKRIIDESYARAKEELIKHAVQLKMLATALLEKEVLNAEEVRQIVGFPAAQV